MPDSPKPTVAPQPFAAANFTPPPPPSTPAPAPSREARGQVTVSTMTIDGIQGGAALIGISQGPLEGDKEGTNSGPNVHIVIKASSRLRLREFLMEAMDDNEAVMKSDRAAENEEVYLHISTHHLMLPAK